MAYLCVNCVNSNCFLGISGQPFKPLPNESSETEEINETNADLNHIYIIVDKFYDSIQMGV